MRLLCRNTKTGHIYDYNDNLRGQVDLELLSQREIEEYLKPKTKEVAPVVEIDTEPEVAVVQPAKRGRKSK